MKHNKLAVLSVVSASLFLAACGGGDDTETAVAPPPPPSVPESQRIAAATQTANTNASCAASALGPFYWEIGDANGVRASGHIGSGVDAGTMMSIASASKWVYSAYVIQKHNGVQSGDTPFLNFTSGYTQPLIPLCSPTDTVASCLNGGGNLVQNDVGHFSYGGNHMQHHAVNTMGLGNMNNASLTAEVTGQVGSNLGFTYVQPQMAGGLAASATGYGAFLRRMLRGELAIGAALGTGKVCTNAKTCPGAISSPVPDTESWNYSLGHWVEDDPTFGDHAFSSAGAFGFYPWIDSSKTLYGVLAREAQSEQNAGYNSARCGRLIRKAWVTGAAV